MKIIISHDVDHLTVWEHKKDLIIPKFIIRSLIEVGTGIISLKQLYLRFRDFIKNRWNNIEELMCFNKENNIPATFFFGVNKGIGLSYSKELAQNYIRLVVRNKFDVGVHGIEFNNFKAMKTEFEDFKKISGLNKFGIRMHYLRVSKETLNYLDKIGYLFDSSTYEKRNPYKINRMWEFPLHIMDGFIILGEKRWQISNLEKALDKTKCLIEKLYNDGIEYLTILFHDRYFSDSFLTWKKWYIKTVNFLKDNKFEFVSYKQAIKELESKQKNTNHIPK